MKRMGALIGLLAAAGAALAQSAAIREVEYDARRVIEVPVARGVATLITLPDREQIQYVGAGRSSDCKKAEDAWCIAAHPETNLIFVKAKSRADRFNNFEVVTRDRSYSFRLTLLNEDRATQRLVVRLPSRGPSSPMIGPAPASLPLSGGDQARGVAPAAVEAIGAASARAMATAERDERDLVAERLAAEPTIANASYSLAIGDRSDDIVPTGVYDDGRFTYIRLPGNREIPGVFHVTADGEEAMVNTRMQGELLVVDRVSRLMRLRLGGQVVSVINEAFDLHGRPARDGTTVDGVERVLRAASNPSTR